MVKILSFPVNYTETELNNLKRINRKQSIRIYESWKSSNPNKGVVDFLRSRINNTIKE